MRVEGGDIADSVAAMSRLGETTADLHLALASGAGSDFSPEPIGASDIQRWRQAIREEVRIAAEALSKRQIRVDASPLLHRADEVIHQ